jgi:hypothetical protein
MNRISKAAALTIVAGATILGTAGGAAADGHHGGNSADAKALGAFNLLSGNAVQLAPINVPIDVCGSSLSLIGFVNPAIGNTCVDIKKK